MLHDLSYKAFKVFTCPFTLPQLLNVLHAYVKLICTLLVYVAKPGARYGYRKR